MSTATNIIPKGYKQTEVGLIPKDWDVKRLGEVASFCMGGTPGQKDINSNNAKIPWIKGSDLEKEYIYTAENFITEIGMNNSRARYYDAGTVLIGRAGQGKTRGKTAILRNKCTTNETMIGIFLDQKKVISEYLHFNLKLRYKALRDIGGDQSRAGITQKDLQQLLVPVPTVAEQFSIAAVLSDVDALIATLDAVIVKKQQIKQGAMQELLKCKHRLPGFSGKWEIKRLGEIAIIATGNTPPTRDAANYGDEFLFVSPVDLGKGKFVLDTERKLSSKGLTISRQFPKGSILFTCIGSTIGKCGIAPAKVTSNQQINAIFPSTIFSTDYIYYSLCMLAPEIKALAGEQAVPIVNKSQFSDTEVQFPSLPEQEAIAAVLSDMDIELFALERRRDKTRDLKQGMMQELLAGKTRLI